MPHLIEVEDRSDAPAPRAARRRLRLLPVLLGVLLGLGIVVLTQVVHIFWGGNFYEVIPGKVFRSAQLSPEALEEQIRDHHIRTVINLRGNNCYHDWYHREREAARHQGAAILDVNLWAYQPPPPGDLLDLVNSLERAQTPILVHCYSGSDRAGLASVFALLLRTDTPLAVARRQLTLYFGHSRWGKAGCHDQLLDRYEEWLHAEGQPHSAARLRNWVEKVYNPEDVLR